MKTQVQSKALALLFHSEDRTMLSAVGISEPGYHIETKKVIDTTKIIT